VIAELRGLVTGNRAGPACRGPWIGRSYREGPLVRRTVLVAALVWFVYAMLHGRYHAGLGTSGTDLSLTAGVAATVASLLLGILLARRVPWASAVSYAACACLGVLLYTLVPDRPAGAVIFAAVGFAAGTHSMRRSVPVVAIAAVGMFVTVLVQSRPAGELWTIVGMLGMFTGVQANRTREAAQQTERQNLVLAERSHIAREIHDILAHSLSAQLVHLEGARLLIATGRTDEALDRVERARGLARSGLEETRRALATLRGDVPPIDEVLRELAEEHRVLADSACTVTITGEPRDLPAKAGLAVIRTAQEALTNVRKHAPGADVTITLRYAGGWCELEVTDSGGRHEPGQLAASGGGYGLVGMRERAELIGGTLDAGSAGEGFSVLLRVPL
jgi:signal transduction histidine kinase